MRNLCLKVFLVVGIVILQVSLANAGVIFSDDFNAEHGGVGILNYTGFANWTISNGSVDLIGNGYYDFYPGNGLYVDLDGSTGDAGRMTSDTIAPGNYIFSFVLGGSTRGDANTVNVSFGNYSEGITLDSSAPLTTYTYNVNVPVGGSAIIFDHAGGDNLGLILDHVKVSTTPVPSALLLMGSGLLGLLGLRFRNR